jgi:hypothetical protein
MPGIAQAARRYDKSVLFLGSAGCPPIIGVAREDGPDCPDASASILERLVQDRQIGTVILISRYTMYTQGWTRELGPAERGETTSVLITDTRHTVADPEGRQALFKSALTETVESLLRAGKRVVLVYPIPEVGYNVPATLARLALKGEPLQLFTQPLDAYRARQRPTFDVLDGIGTSEKILRVYPHERLCENNRCIVFADGKPLYRDDDHLSVAGAEFISPLFDSIFKDEGPQIVGRQP